MEPEKPLEEKIEEIIKKPLNLDALRKIIDEPHKYSVDDFMKIITSDPIEFEDMARRIVVRDVPGVLGGLTDSFEDDFDLMYDFIGNQAFLRDPFHSFSLSKYFNISLYYALISRSDEDLRRIVQIGREINKESNNAAKGYYSSLEKVLESKIDFDKWVQIGKDILQLNKDTGFASSIFSSVSKRYFENSKQVLSLDIDFFNWAEPGLKLSKQNWNAGFVYFRSSILALKSNIDFDKWVEAGKSVLSVNDNVGTDYFECSENALNLDMDFFNWAETGKELAKIHEAYGRNYFYGFKQLAKSGIDLNKWLNKGMDVLNANKEAGPGFFAGSNACVKAKKLDAFLNLVYQQQNPEDFDFLRYRFKFSDSKLNELKTIEYLLNNPKQKEVLLPESIEHNIFYTKDLGKKIEDIGRNLFHEFYFAVKNRNSTYAENYKNSEFKEIFDAIRGHSFQGKNLRKEIIQIFKDTIKGRDLSDVETRTFQKVLELIDNIELKKVKHSITDFFNHLSSYLTGTNPFTKIRMHAHKRFADELVDNRTLDSCTFGPMGSKREACLGYSADPNIEMIFLSTYLHDAFIDNIGVAYLVNTQENVWLLDGVDAGPAAKQLPGFDWKELFYDDLIKMIQNAENPPDKVFMNVNLGPKKTPNEFLEYVCKRKGIKYKKEVTRIKVNESEKIKTVLNKPLLSESRPEAYDALGTDKAYLEAWYDCEGSPWNSGRGEVEVIELLNLLDS